MWKCVFALVFVISLNACGLPSNVVVLVPDEAGTVGEISVAQSATIEDLSAPYTAVETDRKRAGRVFSTNRLTVETEFAGALASTPRRPAIYAIFFMAGQTVPDPRSAETLAKAITAARSTPFADISVVGHSDAAGQDSANRVLSLYRARTIRKALVSGGVEPSTIDLGYFGSSNPRVPQQPGVPEPGNRRVEVTIR